MDAAGPRGAARRRHVDVPLPARPRELDRGRHDRDPQEHRRRARPGAAARMNFDLTEDQREIKRTAREFLASRYTMEKIRAIALDGEPDPHWDEIVELGWPDIAEYGIVELAVVAEELGYALAPSPLAAHWAAKLLHPGAGGPRDGRDVGRRGRRPKIAVPNADVADTIVVTDGDRVLAVPASAATIEPARALDTTRPLFTVRVRGRRGADRRPLRPRVARDRGDGRRRVRRRRRARHRDGRRLRQGAQAVRPRDRLLPGRLARLRADVPRDRGRAVGHLLGGVGARPRPRAGVHGRQLRQGLRLRRGGQRCPLGAPGPRRHRLHVGARPASVPQARRGQRARVRRRALASRAGRRGHAQRRPGDVR